MTNNGLSNVEAVYASEEVFNRLSFAEHLVFAEHCKYCGDIVKFNRHAEKILKWSVTKAAIKDISRNMYTYYGASALNVVYNEVSMQEILDELEIRTWELLKNDFSFIRFFDSDDADLDNSVQVTRYWGNFIRFNLKLAYIDIIIDQAKTYYPNINKPQLDRYVKLRKKSCYKYDLDDTDEVIASTLNCGERAVKSLRTAFAEYDDYYLLPTADESDIEDEVIEKVSVKEDPTEQVQQALSVLSDREKSIIIGVYLNGKTVRELAAELNISKSMVSLVKQGAVKKFTAALV